MKKSLFIIFLISVFVFSGLLAADKSLEETLEELSGQAAKSYVGPIVSAFGSNLNGGWFHKAPKAKLFGFDIEFGLVVMGTMFDDEHKDFSTEGTFNFTTVQAEAMIENLGLPQDAYDALVDAIINQEFEVGMSGATIIGDADDNIIIEFYGEDIDYDILGNTFTQTVPGHIFDLGIGGLLEDTPMLPLFAPQFSIGTIYGTMASFRYLPPYDIEDLGEFNYFGFGIQHNPKAWLPYLIPIDICLAFFTQSMELGDIITANATAFGLNASKTFGPRMLSFTPYAGFMLESSNMEFQYEYQVGNDPFSGEPLPPKKVKFDIDGENTSRLTVGLNFRIGPVNLNGDYNFGKYSSFTAGFGLGF